MLLFSGAAKREVFSCLHENNLVIWSVLRSRNSAHTLQNHITDHSFQNMVLQGAARSPVNSSTKLLTAFLASKNT